MPRPGKTGAACKSSVCTKSCLLMHKSSSLILHSSYSCYLCDTNLASRCAGRVSVGASAFHDMSMTGTLDSVWPFSQGCVLHARCSLTGFFLQVWRGPIGIGGLHPLHLTWLPPPHTWSQILQSPRSSISPSLKGLFWSANYFLRSNFSMSIVKLRSAVISPLNGSLISFILAS